jgi:mRNA interferase MazF
MAVYIPRQGDIIAITFDPRSGHERKGRRPALVVSKDLFNRGTGLAIVCPLTNTEREFPFHVPVPESSSLTGFIMVEQVKSVDYRILVERSASNVPQMSCWQTCYRYWMLASTKARLLCLPVMVVVLPAYSYV